MEPLRHNRTLARLVLAWFLFALGAAVAAPAVQPQTLGAICSSSSDASPARPAPVPGQDPAAASMGLLDCPLCLQATAPPPAAPAQATAVATALPARGAADTSPGLVRSAAPLPGRGPPASA